MTAGYRVVARTTVQITPPPPHLADPGGHHALVGEAVTLRVDSAQELEDLLPGVLADLAVRMTRAVTVHPRRPNEQDRKWIGSVAFEHEVNTGVHPNLRPTPPTPGHMPGNWLDCPVCQHRITEES